MKQQTQKQSHDAPEKLDLFRDTFRGKMPLTDDYVFHAVFGRDTVESKGALMEILNIILARKQDPIRAIVIKKSNRDTGEEMEKGTVMDIKAETDAGELLNIEMQANSFSGFYQSRALFYGGRLVNSSLQGGEKYDKMRKSIVVSIIDGKLFSPSWNFAIISLQCGRKTADCCSATEWSFIFWSWKKSTSRSRCAV